jgi:hypothetical protein
MVAYLSGSRAPALIHKPPRAWGDAQPIFNGKELSGLEPPGGAKYGRTVKDREPVNLAAGANLKTSGRSTTSSFTWNSIGP